MHGKHRKKAPRFLLFRWVAAAVLAVAVSVSSFATVMANTVSANVMDGDESYTFSMNSAELGEILAQAQDLGLEPLGPLDVAERVENTTTVIIRRGVSIAVEDAGARTNLVAYRGDTVLKTLEDHNILIKDTDRVEPSRNTLVEAGMTVEIRRSCQITVAADGEEKKLTLVGGTVADALKEAGVSLGRRDTVNYSQDEALFDSMVIRVSRPTKITVTADGQTGEFEISATTVEVALEKCGVELSENDRLNVGRKEKPADGMEIVVTRVTVEEQTETETLDYPTQYVTSDEMYEDETAVRTPGEPGQKEVTYRLTYVEGELESKEAVSEETIQEPVPEVVVQGTLERPAPEEEIPEVNTAPSGGTSGGNTFVDMYGNTVSYSKKLVGECTAACIPGGTTSIGMTAQYGVIAVDPSIIPYGTRMYVVSPDGSVVYGYGVAGDTGGALLSGRVLADLYYNTLEECSIIGRRDMVVYLLD